MTKDREFWRYTFAGQAMAATIGRSAQHTPSECVMFADALLAVLEASAPKVCEHEWVPEYSPGGMPSGDYCRKCNAGRP